MLEKKPSPFIERFISTYEELSHKEEKIGMVNCYSSKLGGSYMVILREDSNKKHFIETVEKLKTEYPDVQLAYSSRIDGISEDGLQIEQHLHQNIFSPYTQKSKFMYKNNK